MDRFTSILDRSITCTCGRAHATRTRAVHIERGALERVPGFLQAAGARTALVVADERTLRAAGDRVIAGIEAAGLVAPVLVIQDTDDHPPCADDETVALVRSRIDAARPHMVVSVGAGTINDVAKRAAHEASVPYVTCPTAPSMNGYTSAIAAILSGGVKRTIAATQPVAVFADLDVLVAAPRVMRLAGFGDLCSKPFSNADWILAHALTGEYYCEVPANLLDGPFRALLEHARGIGDGEPEAVAALTETLLLSGFSMAMAGSSSPASGGEHLVSHYWDMVEHAGGRPVRALHGVQVGVATLLTGRLYERVLGTDIGSLDLVALAARGPRTAAEREAEVRGRHPLLPDHIVDGVVSEALAKFEAPEARLGSLRRLAHGWPALREKLAAVFLPPARIEAALRIAGAPTAAAMLGVDGTTLTHTLRVCRDIRSRFTILDLADALDMLEDYAALAAEAVD